MSRRLAACAAVAAALVMLPAAVAAPAPITVNVEFSDFSPTPVDVLPGETVEWSNVSERRHTVTADDGSFDSGDLFGGNAFSRQFDQVGTYAYHCTVHSGMVGEVDVRRVTLGPLPTAPVPAGQAVEFEGRTADPSTPVRIERTQGTGFVQVATAMPAADGTWTVTTLPGATGDYRAASGSNVSQSRHMRVADRKITVRATRTGIAVTVEPALPYGLIALQQELRERFGWWPVKRTRLDYVSSASFRVPRPARVRVALLDADGWSPLVISKVVTLGHVGRTPKPMPMHHH